MTWTDKGFEGDPTLKIIKIEIKCGENTCASAPGVFCRFLGTVRFGAVSVCRLFPDHTDSHTVLDEVDGWVQRCDACKEAK